MEVKSSAFVLGAAFVVVLCLATLSCGRFVITKGELNQRIYKDLPLGSTKEQVIKYLDSLEIRGHKITHSGYKIDGIVDVSIIGGREIRVLGSIFAVFDGGGAWILPGDASIGMIFYFDESGKLVNYVIENFG